MFQSLHQPPDAFGDGVSFERGVGNAEMAAFILAKGGAGNGGDTMLAHETLDDLHWVQFAAQPE